MFNFRKNNSEMNEVNINKEEVGSFFFSYLKSQNYFFFAMSEKSALEEKSPSWSLGPWEWNSLLLGEVDVEQDEEEEGAL